MTPPPTSSGHRLALVYGSTRDGRLCDRIVDWTAQRLATLPDVALDFIDPLAFDLPLGMTVGHPATAALTARLAAADAAVIVTPEYNHSFPAPLKALLDVVGSALALKPVAFVAYGGVSGGLRAVEHLRPVLAELDAVGVRETVSIARPWSKFAADGTLADADAERMAAALMPKLLWWTKTLAAARATLPRQNAA